MADADAPAWGLARIGKQLALAPVIDAKGEDLEGMNGHGELIAGDGQRGPLRLLEKVGENRAGGPLRYRERDLARLARPLIGVKDETVAVLCLLHRRQYYILCLNRSEGLFQRLRTAVRSNLHGLQLIVVLIAMLHGESLLPVARVWVEGIAEVLMPAIGFRIRPDRRTQQRETQHIALIVVSKLGLIDQAESVLSVTQVCPALGGNLELCPFPTVVPRRGTFNAAERNLIGGMAVGCGQREGGLQQNVRLMPVDVVHHINLIGSGIQRDILHKL